MEATVLSVKNPYSYLICSGAKDVENRGWKTEYRGRLYIHSSGEHFPYAPEDHLPENFGGYATEERYDGFCRDVVQWYERQGVDIDNGLPKVPAKWFCRAYAIIGHVDLVDIVRDAGSPFAEKGSYHWILKNPVLFDNPITDVKGKLSLWRYEI